MLIISRKFGQEIYIGDNIRIVVYKSSTNRIQVGIDAPEEVVIKRAELLTRPTAKKSDHNTSLASTKTEHTLSHY